MSKKTRSEIDARLIAADSALDEILVLYLGEADDPRLYKLVVKAWKALGRAVNLPPR